ncbi:hypothetical protein BLNAU_16770 [Blattamonas nauphoetae]|uniref:Protein kinase domain-containing protein n=1 Tax=Blattamonas nauphoetae TaxID=2049346 RepID=A0ABQ9X822_9EUKA|nr:hypothetical protein BLNAU_16770 [Blattamonas nauphoetae]
MITPLFAIIVTLSWVSSESPSTSHAHEHLSHDFATFLEDQTKQKNEPLFSTPSAVIVPNGMYHAHGILIHSRNLDVSGLSSTISHRKSVHNLELGDKSQHPHSTEYPSTNSLSVMFDVWNSTFNVNDLQLFANTPHTAVSLIRASTFVISRSEITSCPDTSPFVIGHSGMDSSVSVSVISCRHRSSSESSSLLPLVSGPPSLWCSSHFTTNEEGHPDTFGVRSLSIIGTGLNTKSVHFWVGTGPLFDFGTCLGNCLRGVVGCTVSLTESSLTNTTSTPSSSTVPRSCLSLTQRLIGVSVSKSTNHLSGTSGMPLDWAGSSLLSNSSFSSCITNTAPEPLPEPILDENLPAEQLLKYFEHSEHIELQSAHDPNIEDYQIWITTCTFDGLSSTASGTAVNILNFKAHVVIKNSSITNCHTTGSYGAVSVVINSGSSLYSKFSLTLFDCMFSNNTAMSGGHLMVQHYHPVNVGKCTFKDSQLPAGSSISQFYPVVITIEGNCRFDQCTVSNNEGSYCGGLYFNKKNATSSIIFTDVLFDNNECTRTPASQRVSDCGFAANTDLTNNQFHDCFSTSAQPRCGTSSAAILCPDWVGPSITSVAQTIKKNGKGDGFEVVLSFDGKYTGTSRKYDVTLEDEDGTQFVAEKMSFTKTAGTVAFAIDNPSTRCLSASTTYTIIDVQKSSSQSTSNEFVIGEGTEPDWTWWYHTSDSRADNMVGLSFTTPAVSELTNIELELDPSNLDEVKVVLTVDSILAGSFKLVVFDESDPQKKDITIGPISISSSSTPTTVSHTVVIRPSGVLSFGKTYTVKTLSSSTLIVSHISPPFTVPSLLRTASASLNLEDITEVTLNLTAFGFPSSTPIELTIIEVDDDDSQTGSSFTVTETQSTAGDSTCILKTGIAAGKLQRAKRYEITQCDIAGKQAFLDGRVIFRVPDRPTISEVEFAFATKSNTTFRLVLKGIDLPVWEPFLVSLDGFDEDIEVTFTSLSEGSSAELPLGWSDTLQFDSEYPLSSVNHAVLSTVSIPSAGLLLRTKPCPSPLILHANDSTNSDPKFCGAVERPCSSVNVAKNLVDGLAAPSSTIQLIKKAAITNPITVDAGHELKLTWATLTPPTLVVPSTASLGDSEGLVAGTLLVENVNIDVQIETLSFVLFDVSGGELVMDSVHITGVPSSSDLVKGIEGLCEWETGLIKLHSSTCTLTSCVLLSIGMGEIWMESSNLSLISTQILSNGARFSSFPSAQQDVMCKSGNISIHPNSSDTTTDRWISSSSECSVLLNGSELKSPHFLPSLDVKSTKSTQSKKKDFFSVLIVGSKLIPCNLKLEVSEESSSQSSTSNTPPILIPLSFTSDDLWNETRIDVTIPTSSLSNLSSDKKWTASVFYGENKLTESFTFLPSLKERKSQAFKKTLAWLIPVIVVCVVALLSAIIILIICWRRKRQAASKDLEEAFVEDEMDEGVVEKMEVEVTTDNSTKNVIGERSDEDGRFGLIQPDRSSAIDNRNSTTKEGSKMGIQVEAMKCQDDFGIVMVSETDTLFNKLHNEHVDLGSKKGLIQRQIVMGLQKLAEQNNLLNFAASISSRWILLDTTSSVLFKLNSSLFNLDLNQTHASSESTTMSLTNNLQLKDVVEEIRWRAPEQGEKDGDIRDEVDKVKASVFRLGLILWEIETGLVPFGDLDAVHAHQQLAASVPLPLQKITDSSMRDLIEECLRVDPSERPTLSEILSRLEKQPNQSQKLELKDQFPKL